MRILILCDIAAPIGGAEILMWRLRDGLRKIGHDARIFATNAYLKPTHPQPDYVCFGTSSRWKTLLQTGNPWVRSSLRSAIKDFQPDIAHLGIFLTQLSPKILDELRDIPCVAHLMWYRLVCPNGIKRLPNGSRCTRQPGATCMRCLPLQDIPLFAVQYRSLYSKLDAIDRYIMVSESMRQTFSDAGIKDAKVIWPGVPKVDRMRDLAPEPTIGFVGRLVPEKGAEVLLRAFAQVRSNIANARLVIIGDGKERSRLQQKAESLGLASALAFRGAMLPEQLDASLQSCWVQVVPSLWAEIFGLVAAEAMMRGTPVVASNIGGLSEFITHESTGMLVPPGDIDSLATTLTSLIRNNSKRESLSVAARSFALKHLTIDRCIQEFEVAYADLLSVASGRCA